MGVEVTCKGTWGMLHATIRVRVHLIIRKALKQGFTCIGRAFNYDRHQSVGESLLENFIIANFH